MNAATKARIAQINTERAITNGQTVALVLTGEAYCSKSFDRIYDEHAARIGHRPAFTVTKAFRSGMIVMTTPADADHARAIISAVESV